MPRYAFYIIAVAALPMLLGMDGCLTKTVNHCVNDPAMQGCAELCLDQPELEHCELIPPDVFVDGGACGRCTVNVPFCDEATVECVECTTEAGCECLGDADCPDGAPVCGADGQCGGCSASVECMGRAQPVCDSITGECIGCTEDAQCADLEATPVCDEASGRCVECTVETEESDCPATDGEETGPACDPVDLACTGELRNTLGFCKPCISDSECISTPGYGTRRCVPMHFQGTAVGTFCLLDRETHRAELGEPTALCPDRQPSAIEETSVLGTEATYCFVRQGVTSCEAVLGFSAGPCTDDAECGLMGMEDAVCRDSACTYLCSNDDECFGGAGSCSGDPATCNPNI